MSTPTDLRSRKRLAMRETISDAATLLFLERGFDRVTVDEVAAAADVGRMTVFNHFPRKEDLFFDRDDEFRLLLREALQQRGPRVSPIEALRLLAHRMVVEQSPYLSFTVAGQGWVETVDRSETLKARARAIRDEIAQFVAVSLAESVGRDPSDTAADFAANLLLATWTVAFLQGHQVFRESGDGGRAKERFLALVDQGGVALKAAMKGTPYA
jgi:AcrR family transcriptional regulator